MTLVDRLPPFFVALVGMVLLTIMDATVKSLSTSYSTAQIVFVRFLLIGLIIGTMVVSARQSWPPARRLAVHFGRAVLMLITSSTFFYALGRLPLADVFVLSLTSPIFIALFAALFLKESVKPAVAIAIVAGFAGVFDHGELRRRHALQAVTEGKMTDRAEHADCGEGDEVVRGWRDGFHDRDWRDQRRNHHRLRRENDGNRLACGQGSFRALAFRDVARDAAHTHDASALLSNRR